MAAAAPVPAGSTVVHIGVPKSGTTAVQGALDAGRERLAGLGVIYAGHPRKVLRRQQLGQRTQELIEKARRATDARAVLSSEYFTDCSEASIPDFVADLGGSSVHIVVTVRPLARILPSQWQQYVRSGIYTPYHEWLEQMFTKPLYGKPNPTFWWRHRHDLVVERWARAVGTERMIVIVADDHDRSMLYRAFESILDLPSGALVPGPSKSVNRSLTFGELELVRLLHEHLGEQGLRGTKLGKAIWHDVKVQLRAATPEACDQGFPTPAWALQRAAEVGAEIGRNIADSGVRVIGDLGLLTSSAPKSDVPQEFPPPMVSSTLAAQAVLGSIISAQRFLDREALEAPS